MRLDRASFRRTACAAVAALAFLGAGSTRAQQADVVPPTLEMADLPPLAPWGYVVVSGRAVDQDGSSAGLSAALISPSYTGPLALDPLSGTFTQFLWLVGGANEIVVEVTDAAGNVARRAFTVTCDFTAPMIEVVTPPADSVIATPEFTLSVLVHDETEVTVVVDGWKVVPVVNGFATTTLAVPKVAGAFWITIQATDTSGNQSSTWHPLIAALSSLGLSVDVASGTAFGPLKGNLLPVRIDVDAPLGATVEISGGATFAVPAGRATIDAEVALVEGSNTFTVTATDATGEIVAVPVTVLYDTTPPAARFLAPSDGDAVHGVLEISLEALDASTAVAAATFSVDGGAPIPGDTAPALSGAATPVWTANIDAGGLADGVHTISAAVTDAVGNLASPSVTVFVDRTPPSVSVDSPLAGAYVSGAVSVSASASDATSGVRTIRLLANGVEIGSCDAAARCAATFDSATLPDGQLALSAIATDLAGNEAFAQALVTSDNRAPASFLRAPASGQVVAGTVEIVFQIDDPGFAWAECTAGGDSLGRRAEPAFRQAVDVTKALDGPLEIACTAVDLAGNEATEAVTVTVRNWSLHLHPRVLHAGARPGWLSVVALHVEGGNVALLAQERDLALAVPGGASAPLVRWAPAKVHDLDRDGTPDLVLMFERAALLSAIRGGLSAGAVAKGTVTVRLVAGARTLGSTTLEVR